jgi:outer membrane lipoprotein SlyB
MKTLIRLSLCLLAGSTLSVFAQSSGQGTTVKMGVIDKAESVTLQNTGEDAGKGAVIGGVIGYNVGSGKSSSKKRRHAVLGGAIGAAAGSSGTAPGMEYTVKLVDGSTVVVVSDQVHMKAGDCVSIEQVKNTTNIREQDPVACKPEAKEALSDPKVQDELAEDAEECAQVKQELLEAQTIEAVEIATAKAKILCN